MSYRRVVTSIDINKINEEFVDVTKREISEKWGETKVRTRHETSFVLARVNPPYSCARRGRRRVSHSIRASIRRRVAKISDLTGRENSFEFEDGRDLNETENNRDVGAS